MNLGLGCQFPNPNPFWTWSLVRWSGERRHVLMLQLLAPSGGQMSDMGGVSWRGVSTASRRSSSVVQNLHGFVQMKNFRKL